MDDLIKRLVENERTRFSVNEYRGLPDAPPFTFEEGSIAALVSAPHAVTHMREGRIKASEDFTGPLALELARLTGAHALVATRFDDCDPNFDPLETSAYKQALVDFIQRHGIRLVLDIHGMVTASPAIIALGTGDGANVAARPKVAEAAADIIESRLASVAERHGKQIAVDGRFAARDANTVCATVARSCGIAALQVELSTLLRYPGGITGHTPPGEQNPFAPAAMAPELSARANPDPAAVATTVSALASIITL